MKLCRFKKASGQVCPGIVSDESTLIDLSSEVESLTSLFEAEDFNSRLTSLAKRDFARIDRATVRLITPVERQEVWAVGVTYLRSKKARMEESDFSATAYDKVYDAPRPELFFKSFPEKVVGPCEQVGIRSDSQWSVPEPELTFVINSRGMIVGFTVGNDMSSRDIEGENLLYLSQAKIYQHSCAVGPVIVTGISEAEARMWKIKMTITRNGQTAFEGETSVNQIKRTFGELVEYLFRSQQFPQGAVLLTGTGIVPPDGFTLQERDGVRIDISGVGSLENIVTKV